MRNLFLSLVLAAAWLLLSPALPPAVAQNYDTVADQKNNLTIGTIVEMNRQQVTVETRAGKRTVEVNNIRKVQFGDEPRELRSAREAILKDQVEQAQADLSTLNAADISRAAVREDLEFYRALVESRLALTGGGDKVRAVQMMRKFLESSETSNSFHYFEGVELLGDLALALDSQDNALKYYGELEAAPWPEYALRGKVLTARALQASGKDAEALTKFDEVLQSTLDSPEANQHKQSALIGKAVCLAATQQAAQGIELINQVIASNDAENNQRLFGRAYNALGQCYLRAGQPKEALMAFLHTDLLFSQDPEVHAEALYHLSSLWREAGNNADRAIRASSTLKNRYAGSKWAKK